MLTFGEKLHQLREEKNISIRELERKTGISNSYLSQLENGKRPRPSQEVIAKIGKVLGNGAYNRLMVEAGYLKTLSNAMKDIDKMFFNKQNKKLISVYVPEMVMLNNPTFGGKVARGVQDSDIFDLYYLLAMGVDERTGFELFYKGNKIPIDKIKELSKIAQAILE